MRIYFTGGSFFVDYQPVKWNTLRMSLHYQRGLPQGAGRCLPALCGIQVLHRVLGPGRRIHLVKNLSLVGGISYDWFDVTKAQKNVTDSSTGNFVRQTSNPTPDTSEFNPMIGLNYQVADGTKLFGSVARKSRFPTLQQLYSSREWEPALSSEKSLNYTVGVDQALGKVGRMEFALFYYDVTDLISRDAPGVLGVYQNYGNVKRMGFELGGSVSPLDGLLLRGDYVYIDSQNESNGRVTDDVTFSPNHKVDLGAAIYHSPG